MMQKTAQKSIDMAVECDFWMLAFGKVWTLNAIPFLHIKMLVDMVYTMLTFSFIV